MGMDIEGMFKTFYSIVGFLVLVIVIVITLWEIDRRKRKKK